MSILFPAINLDPMSPSCHRDSHLPILLQANTKHLKYWQSSFSKIIQCNTAQDKSKAQQNNYTHKLADDNNNKDKLKWKNTHTSITTMRITPTMAVTYTSQEKSKGWKQEDWQTVEALPSSQLYHHWMAPELISCNAPYCQNSCMWCVCGYLCVCVGGLTLGVAAKHKFQEKDKQHKKRDIQLARPAPTCSGQVGQLYTLCC